MRRTLWIILAVVVVTTALVPARAAAATPGALRWGPCPADVASPGLECSTLEVPLDYRHPDGQKIKIMVSRLASRNPSQRRGVLLTNDGGPGGPDLTFPAFLVQKGLPQSVLDSYDVIGFDPRGVGYSTPVTCDLTPMQQARGKLPPYAVTAADVTKQAEEAKNIARQCAASKTAWMLPYVTTANTARDMDRIRAALGEPKISYYGTSYGTYLGAVYTTLFPQRSDRIVLDSNLGPGGFDTSAARLIGRGFQDRFPDFAKFAAAHPKDGLGTTRAQVTAKYFELAARLDKTPIQGVNGAVCRKLTFIDLYFEEDLPKLAAFWQAVNTSQQVPELAALRQVIATNQQLPVNSPESDVDNENSSFSTWSAATPAGQSRSGPTRQTSRSTGSGIRCTARLRPTSSRARSGQPTPSNRRCGSVTEVRRTCSCCRTSATLRHHWPAPENCDRRSVTEPGW